MRKLILGVAAATALAATAAVAAPLSPAAVGVQAGSAAEQVRLVCDEYGRCFRTRGPRYVQPYGYGGGYGRGYGGPRYERRGYYGGGPGVSFGFGGRGW